MPVWTSPTTWSRCSTPGTPPTKRSPRPSPVTPRPCAAACSSCPYACGGTRTGRASPRCRPRVPSCGGWPAPGEGHRGTGCMRNVPRALGCPEPRQVALGVATSVAPDVALGVAGPVDALSHLCRSVCSFGVVGLLTSSLRPLLPMSLAGVEEREGGMGGADAAGDRGALVPHPATFASFLSDCSDDRQTRGR